MPRYIAGHSYFWSISMISIQELYKLFKESTGVQTDTRKLRKGEMFFALKGDNFNGNSYAKKALEEGASCAIIDDPSLENITGCYLVTNVLASLQQLAKYHRQQFDIPFLAITGSNGKTTTKELVACVLSKKFNVQFTKGNLNNHIGVPLTLLSIRAQHDFAIIEMGANHQGEIASYCEWAQPNFGLINNCGKAHLEGFGGIEGVRKGKGELYDAIREREGLIFRNADYDYLKEMAVGIDKQVTYGAFQGDYRAKIYQQDPFLKIANITNGQEQIIPTNLVGDYNLANVLAALAIGGYFEVPSAEVVDALANYQPNNNRSEHRVINGVHIILDAYNANPTSMKAALDSFADLKQENKIVMLGAMMELGDDSLQEHAEVLSYAQEKHWKHVVTVGEEFKQSAQEKGIIHFEHVGEAKEWYHKYVTRNDWVYIKGSRLTAMEKIIEE